MNLSGAPQPAGGTSAFARFMAHPAGMAGLLSFVTLAVFWPALRCGFVNYDDPLYYQNNPHVLAGLTWDGLRWAFTTGTAGNWHPLTWLSLMLDAQLFGPGPAGPHLTNVLLHAVNTVLLFLLLRRLTAAHWRSAVVAALFALHPLHVESVAWIAERKDVLSGCFGLLTVWFYVEGQQAKGQGQKYHLAALLCFALGLMSKPMLVTLPCVLLLLDWWPLGRMKKEQGGMQNWRRLLVEKIPFFALTGLACVTTFWAQQKADAVMALSRMPLSGRLENALVSYARYLGKTFWPVDLATPYPHPGSWPVASVAISTLLVFGVTGIAVWQWRKRPALFVGWLWFLGMLVPVIGLVQVGSQAMADRYTYLPLVGIFIAVVWLLGDGITSRLGSKILVIATLLVLGACAVGTRAQVGYWQNGETLFGHTLAVTGPNRVASDNLGAYLAGAGRLPEAAACYAEALRTDPGNTDAWYNWGNALTKLGDLPGAVEKYARALQSAPDRADILNNLGFALAALHRSEDAVAAFEAALRSSPDFADAHNNLATVLFGLGRFAEAETHYRAAARLSPDNAQVRSNLGDVLRKLGRTAEAAESYQQALHLDPSNVRFQERLRKLTTADAP